MQAKSISQKMYILYSKPNHTSSLSLSHPHHQDPSLTPGPAAANAAGAAEEVVGKPVPPRVDLIEFVIGKNSQ